MGYIFRKGVDLFELWDFRFLSRFKKKMFKSFAYLASRVKILSTYTGVNCFIILSISFDIINTCSLISNIWKCC